MTWCVSGVHVVEVRYGSWSVEWRDSSISISDSRTGSCVSFTFNYVILPVHLVLTGTTKAVVKLDSSLGVVEVLSGVEPSTLGTFKRRFSWEVLANVGSSPYFCSDCAREAGVVASMWDGTICPGCREYYCKNKNCLRRLRLVVLRDGSTICEYCGTRE